MRCRYCGKELALLKRLTGGGGFCSEAHKQSYQDEYNQLALRRLLQAQKGPETESSGKSTATPVAVEEPAAKEPAFNERPVTRPVTESAPLEISNLEASLADNRTGPDGPAAALDESGAEPLETAGFLSDSPTVAAWPDESPPHLEPWLEFSSGPAVADWQFQDGAPTLSTAAPVSLDLQPSASRAAHAVAPANVAPGEFENGHRRPTPPWKVATPHRLPSAGPVSIEINPSAIDFAADRSIAEELGFQTAVVVEDSELADLPSTGIEFPLEDSSVLVVFRPTNRAAIDSPPVVADSDATVADDGPRSSLEALSRLHQDLVQQEEARAEEPPVPVAEPALVAEPEPQSGTPAPGRATELLDIAIRMFPPAKPVPLEGAGLVSESEPLLPHLKSLPLRPKMAVAHGYAQPSTSPAQPKGTAAAAQTMVPPKPAPVPRPAARFVQPKHLPAATQPPEPSKLATRIQPAVQAPASSAAPAKPVVEEIVKPEIAKSAPTPPVNPTPGETAPEIVPNFGAIQLPNPSFMGSLKVKLGIAIALLVVACSTWLGWGGKSRNSGASNPAISADGSGPSIILGEGGWVEDWGGDRSGANAGREITIYRPSLKLSDYRIQFQASIDTKSVGWVFRAADPDNYYAMKLTEVSSGLHPKVALFKYLVLNGVQTQVGRVPIDLTVQADTVFDIRTDVRGPQFSTYVQGRLVDVWTDDQLKAGGVGFLNEREERGKVKSVSIRYLNGGK